MGDRDDPGQVPSTTRLAAGAERLEIRGFALRVIEGPARGALVAFRGQPLRIGKGRDCDLKLDDPAVSRVHAIIGPTAKGFLLEDQQSTNGTRVDGVAIQASLLHDGCRIQMGNSVMVFDAETWHVPDVPHAGPQLEGMLGNSPAMRSAMGLIQQVGPSQATVVLRGETGAGKEVAARAIHALSDRRDGPFVVCDCGNLNRDLMGSELFGHRKGAFTGATGTHRGVFERAQHGTLLLDEIGELPQPLQTRLLGVLQRREVQPLGAEDTIPLDVRVLAATHRDLEALVETGAFRQDLYFRLAVFTIVIPPLRERREDIGLLAESFVAELGPRNAAPARLSEAVRKHLSIQPWKGNVRELRNAVERGLVLAGNGPLAVEHFAMGTAPVTGATAGTIADAERQLILDALTRNEWHRDRTARELGISLSTLKRRVREYGLTGLGPPSPGPGKPDDD